jgi:hypothetical protein
MVRVSTRVGRPSISGSSDGRWLNSPYASSMITMAGPAACAASYSRSTVAVSTAVPVGLFGEQMKTTAGRRSAMTRSAAATSMVKSSCRGPEIQPVPVPREIRACIEYEGSKPMAVRPGPAKVCSSCWMTSLEPLAAHTPAASTWWPAVRER